MKRVYLVAGLLASSLIGMAATTPAVAEQNGQRIILAQSIEQLNKEGVDILNDELREVGADRLRWRIKRSRFLMTQPIRGGIKKQLRTLIQRDRKRLAKLQGGNNQQQQGGQQQQQQDNRANREARNFLRNTQDLGGMNDRQLGQTIRVGRNLMQNRDVRQRLQRQVRQRVQQARNERRRRQDAVQQQREDRQQEKAQKANRTARQYLRSTQDLGGLNDRRLNRAIANGRALANNRHLEGRLQDQVRNRLRAARAERQRRQNAAQQQQNQQQQHNANNTNREARDYLRSTDNLRGLNDRQLRRAVRRGRALLQNNDLGGRLQRRVRERVSAARAERQRRQNAAQQQQQDNTNADAAARRLLNDSRAASALRDGQLRRRLQSARQIMRERDLNRRLFRQVRRMARGDAEELRARVARRNENLAERREDRQDARQLLRDRRPARRLNDRQLQARIKSARDLLAGRSLRPGERNRIEDLLREARREKRNRLIAERQRRRERLAERRRQNQVIIQIPRGNRYEDRGDIAAAEADGALLERQLVAPPKRRINRRYTRSELRRRPELREYMPAIEVDTIRFGFNEAFVREEEIPQLERIGEIIERIVTSNPDEVFVIEGHTDAVGSDAYNLGLSRKRADAVRDAMLRYFNIGSENIETIGYGERYLKINTPEEEAENRRVTIRRITPLLSRR